MKNIFIIFLCFLLFSPQTFGGERGTKPFTFVQIADTQLGFEDYGKDLRSFEQAVKQINEINPDFVVICGDLVNVANDSSYNDFKRIKEKFNMPCYCVPGNHDVGNIPNDTTLTFYRKTIGKDYYSFKHKGCSFIFTNTQLWKADVKNESGKFNKWFIETLKETGKKENPVFVVGHFPLFITEPDEDAEYFNIDPAKRKEILDLFTANHVSAYLSGHTHKLVSNEYKGIQMVSCETTSKNFDKRPFGFRLWEVSSDSIRHSFIPLE